MREDCIVLVGMAGCGKSTVGVRLATALDFGFTDLDEYIRQKDQQTIQSIIDARGEQALLELEEQRMHEIDLRRRVIAPGGSIIYQRDAMQYLKERCVVVFLDETFENIEARVMNAATRGIVGLKGKTLHEIFDERRPFGVCGCCREAGGEGSGRGCGRDSGEIPWEQVLSHRL